MYPVHAARLFCDNYSPGPYVVCSLYTCNRYTLCFILTVKTESVTNDSELNLSKCIQYIIKDYEVHTCSLLYLQYLSKEDPFPTSLENICQNAKTIKQVQIMLVKDKRLQK